LVDAVKNWMIDQKIKDAERMVNMLAPGGW
jgi:hypothetical protein